MGPDAEVPGRPAPRKKKFSANKRPVESGRQAAEEAAQSALTDASTHLKAAGQVLHLFVDDSIPRNASFASVRKKAFALLPPEPFEPVSNYMRNVTFDNDIAVQTMEFYVPLVADGSKTQIGNSLASSFGSVIDQLYSGAKAAKTGKRVAAGTPST